MRLANDESRVLDDIYDKDNRVSNVQFIKDLKNVKSKISNFQDRGVRKNSLKSY